MAKQPPPRPQKGQKVPANWFQDFYDYVVSLEVRGDLKTTTAKRDSSGTIIRAHHAGGASSPRHDAIVATITLDNEDGTYTATEQKNTSGEFSNRSASRGMTFDSGNNGYLYELNELVGVPTGIEVLVHRVEDTDGGPIWYFDSGWGVGSTFEVVVSQVGGVAGDATTQCSFTYDVDSLEGIELGAAMEPEWARPQYGKMVAATKGLAYYDRNAALVLAQVDEVPDVSVCS